VKSFTYTALVHRFIQLMQLDVLSALSRGPSAHGLVPWGRPGPLLPWAPAFAGVAGFDMSDGASLPDESCE
jgi:hypothetical protein